MLTRILIAALTLLLSFPAAAQFSGGFGVGGFGSPRPAGAPAAGLVLDGITSGLKAAYSTRKLLTAYAGSAIRVERGDTTQQNIGFTANELDTSALGTFCSGTTCKVVTWYDQSGNGFDVTQGTVANAPIIYQSGAVTTLNSKPALLYVAANNTYLTNGSLNSNPVDTLYMNAVLASTVLSGGQNIVGPGLSARFTWDMNNLTPRILSALTTLIATANTALTVSTGAVTEVQYNATTGAYAFWKNGSADGSGTQTGSFGANSGTFIGDQFGISGNAQYFDGPIGEVIEYDAAGFSRISSIQTDQKTYWGTP
jgi:hypothetical protein